MSAHIVSAGVLGSRIFIGVYVFYCALLISYKTICNVPWKKHTESIDGNITSVIQQAPHRKTPERASQRLVHGRGGVTPR